MRNQSILKAGCKEVAAVTAVLAMFLFGTPGWAQEINSALAFPSSFNGPLDGREFSAAIVRDDADEGEKNRPLTDKLIFRDGKFSSVVCRRYNFADAPYWVRVEGGRLHFLAELASPTDGTMLWKGTIEGDTLEGTMRWTKKRWYWTIDAEHRIRGKIDGPLKTAPAVAE